MGVVLRRGPTDWARLSIWHTASDTFEHGQWLKGRVYERRSDVSADGSLFVAFVRKSGSRQVKADSWVAVSRPPFFNALALWFVGGTYYTGGFFPKRSSLWLGFNPVAADQGATPPWLELTAPRDIAYIDRTREWPDQTVHFNRLLRDGWTRGEDGPESTNWTRADPRGAATLLMSQHQAGMAPYEVDYSVRLGPDGKEQVIGRASWADWDQQGRLVLAREGRLLHWDSSRGLAEIADFSDQVPDPARAPRSAERWLRPPR